VPSDDELRRILARVIDELETGDTYGCRHIVNREPVVFTMCFAHVGAGVLCRPGLVIRSLGARS
jgi:hypothetical protein